MAEHAIASKRLIPLRELAEHREQEAARKLADVQRQLGERVAQLQTLEQYQEPASTGPVGMHQLRNREAFRARLGDAIGHQRRVIADLERMVQAAREEWFETHRGLMKMEKLIERSRQHERNVFERREQRRMDELALRSAMTAATAAHG
jgi:flagellar FliJ protein